MFMTSVAEFCRSHGFSRGTFYKLQSEGRGPKAVKIGRRTLISSEAAETWRRKMEQEAAIPGSEGGVMRPDRFKLLSLDEIDDLPPLKWLIEGLVPAGSLAVLYGAPKVGKSFLALDWALCTAAGKPWLGRKVPKGDVVFTSMLRANLGSSPELPPGARFTGRSPPGFGCYLRP